MRVCGLIMLVSVLLCACSWQIGRESSHVNMLSGGEATLERTKKVLVAEPSDIVLNGKPETGSGEKTLKAMVKALHAQNVVFTQSRKGTKDELFAEAGQTRAGYVITMKITFWDDPPTFIQQRPDKGQVRLEIFDVESGRRLRADSVECQSYPTLINHIGSGDPGDCLGKGFEEWLGKVFR